MKNALDQKIPKNPERSPTSPLRGRLHVAAIFEDSPGVDPLREGGLDGHLSSRLNSFNRELFLGNRASLVVPSIDPGVTPARNKCHGLASDQFEQHRPEPEDRMFTF